ncbi:MAG: ABC transporter permease [Vulcanimicrobiaceae bacterium]
MNAVATFPQPNAAAVRRYCELVTTFAERNIKARYRGSVLGVFWSLSNPLIMTGVYTLIFGSAFKSYYGNSTLNYVLAVFMGMVVVTFFSQASSQALSSVVANGSLVNKIKIPLSVFPVSVVVANLFQFVVGVLPVIILVTLFASHSAERVLLLIAPAISLLMVTVGASLAASALFVFFRDLPYIYELVVFITWMTSPIFYPEQIVPEKLRIWVHINPIAAIANDIREIAFSPVQPHLHVLLSTIGVAVLALAVGAVAFAALQRWAIDLL